MLYWHQGLKRTGTTSLQTALVACQAELADAGVAYPEQWRAGGAAWSATHHGLIDVVESSNTNDAPAHRFREYLRAHVDDSVLLSSEFVADWLAASRVDEVLEVVSLAQSVMPVTCMWTMRRFDDSVNSFLLRRVLLGKNIAFPTRGDVRRLAAPFEAVLAGMREIEDALGGRVVYLKYTRDGAHNGEILRAVGLPERVRDSVEGVLNSGPRLNPQLTRKAAAAMIHCDEISRRTGAKVGVPELRQAFFLGEFEFADDGPCELMGAEVRQALNDEALAAARKRGVGAYVRFFEDAEVEAGPPAIVDASILTADDVRRLAAYLRMLERQGMDTILSRRFGLA